MLDRLDRTIVAVSSAPGRGAVGIVRLSGSDAFAIAEKLAVTSDVSISIARSFTRLEGLLRLDSIATVPAFFYVFRAPVGYTREDMVEIYTLGSPPLLEWICRKAEEFGAVRALPGEFTARAFLNGGMSLTQAESVAGLIRAQTDTQLRAARRLADGTLHRNIEAARNSLAELLALVEADIDFAEEPIEFITPPELRSRLADVDSSLSQLTSAAGSIERLEVLPHILLLGPPNAGKSSLMNRLSGISRAICSAVAGTTRDILSAPIRLGRLEAILLDSAGVDDSPDEVIAAARELTLSTAQQVDAICLVLDITAVDAAPFVNLPADHRNVVVALNKADLVDEARREIAVRAVRARCEHPVCAVSALQELCLDEFRAALSSALEDRAVTTTAEALFLGERQRTAIAAAREVLNRAILLSATAQETIDCADLLAFELREALYHLAAVAGEVTTEDLLSQVFSRFCIGK